MIKIYTAANLQDAHILLGWLSSEGIAARILNASAQGGLGDIPFTQVYPEIWVDEVCDGERARAVVAIFDAPAREAGTSHRCSACGEECPGSFAVCWQCGALLQLP